MDTKTTLPISEARKKIFKISDEVQKVGRYYTLTEKGYPKVVILSAEEFASIMETMEILSEPKVLRKIKKAEEEYKRGKGYTWDEVKKKLWPKKSLVLREMPKKSYKTARKTKKKE